MLCLVQQHDPRIIAVALTVAVLTLGVGAELWRQSRNASGDASKLWLAATAFCAAIGIWTVHFVAVLAYLPGLETGFALAPTVASLAVMIVFSVGGFFGGVRAPTALGRAGAGLLFGCGVLIMHYLGMIGFIAPGRFEWSGWVVSASAVVGLGFCGVGFLVGVQARGWRRILAGAGAIAVGVLALHFTGMAAMRFHYDPRVATPTAVVSRLTLAIAIAGLLTLVLALGVASLFLKGQDRRRAVGRLKFLSENSFEGMAVVGGERLFECNDAFAAMAGCPREALIGRLFLGELFTPEGDASLDLNGRTEGWLACEGRRLPVEVLCRASGSDLIAAVRDLTERRLREDSLSLLFERNPAPVWVADMVSGQLLRANPAASRLYGYSEEAFLSLKAEQLMPPEEYRDVRTYLKAGVDQYSPDRVWRHLNAAGEELLVLPYVENISFDGRRALLTTVFDVTERERTARALHAAKEAAEASNRAKSVFLANMSHEIRTPLNGVLGMAQAIAADELSPTQRERLEIVRSSGEALLEVLNDILDFSKIESGKMELESIPFELRDLLTGAHQAFGGQAQGKSLAFTLDIDPGIAGAYQGDPTRIRQIVSNLVSNAIKFTETGEVRLEARLLAGGVRIAVADTGPGIGAEQLANLFEKFVQADASTTRRHGGTGLGLAISRELAQLMGGEIEASSVEGHGSTFVLTLPLERTYATLAPAETARAAGAEPEAMAEPLQVKVLAAEDNAVNQLVLKTLLRQAGIDPVVVADGQQAVDAWRREHWDVILMDVQMPVMDGPAATRLIRTEEAAGGRRRTPVIALTANIMSHQLAEYRAAGMDGHVGKPINIGELFSALAGAIDGEDEMLQETAA